MLDLLPLEVISMISIDLKPSSQFSLAFTSRRLWSIFKATIDKHRPLAQECDSRLRERRRAFALHILSQEWPHLLPYVEYFETCPDACLCRTKNRSTVGYLFASPLTRSQNVHHHAGVRSNQPYNILVRLLPRLQSLTRLECQIPRDSRGTSLFWPSSNSLQFLTHIVFWGEKFPLPLFWLGTVLWLPNIRFIHGRFLDSKSPITTSARPPPPPSPSIKELVITNSDLHTLDFDISHIPMETFLYNYVPINRHSTYDPSYIISKLPKTLKHLAILEEEILRLHHRRNDGYWELVVASSLIHFQQLKILWCFWPAIIPADADLENFDLSSVLPKSLTWLVLFSVPEEGVEMLTRALPKMPRLKMIWAQVQEFDGQERRFVVGSTQEVQLTNQFREAACKNGLSWTGPEHRSVFTSYVKYLDIHAWSGCLCENH